jgi:transcriptional regulator with XRE-family HTH domain
VPRRATPDPLAKRIGARIRTLRKEAGLTLEKLAYESDVGSKGFLSDVEAGLARPTVETLSTIAERLEVDLLDLVTFAELAEVMADERAEDLFIGGVVDADDKALVLYRGNLNPLVVPFQWFKPRPKARPDFAAFAITDYGQTVQLGEYEVAADAILYEFDADARRRIKEREIKQDSSFGGALRRLRLMRDLARSDFAPLAEKTIARIERGEVEEPHGETLSVIARRLGVKPDQIKSY